MKQVTKYELIDHGIDHSDYFQGCGVALTEYDECYTGIGNTPHEAYDDAMSQCINSGNDWTDELLNEADNEAELIFRYAHAEIPEDSETTYFASIRIKY